VSRRVAKEATCDLMNKEEKRVVLNIDNKSAISLCKNPVHHDRSKHIDTKYHYIWECVEESKIDQVFGSTEVLADARKDRRPSCEDEHIVLRGVIVSDNHSSDASTASCAPCSLRRFLVS
jgi:hypothetical protein